MKIIPDILPLVEFSSSCALQAALISGLVAPHTNPTRAIEKTHCSPHSDMKNGSKTDFRKIEKRNNINDMKNNMIIGVRQCIQVDKKLLDLHLFIFISTFGYTGYTRFLLSFLDKTVKNVQWVSMISFSSQSGLLYL